MRQIILSVFILLLLLPSCYNQRPDLEVQTYSEPIVETYAVDPLWAKTGKGLHASFASKNIRYAKHTVPMEIVTKDKRFIAWKGECLNAQAVLWAVNDIKQVECVWKPFVNRNNDTIDLENFKARFVRYVLSDEYGNGCGAREKSSSTIQLVADPLDELPSLDMDAQTVRPIWLTLNIPSSTKPGTYSSSLIIYSKKNSPQELRFTIDVVDRELTNIDERSFHLNMKQDPLSIALWHDVKPWCDKHFEIMKPYMQMLANAGQKSISCSLHQGIEDEWTFDVPTSMVKWYKENGRWSFNFDILEQWVKFMYSQGIVLQINLYSILPENKQVLYLDTKTNETNVLSLESATTERSAAIHAYLDALKTFLSEKGWLAKTRVVIKDKDQVYLSEFINEMQSYIPELKITLITQKYRPNILDNVQHLGLSASYISAESMIELKRGKDTEASLFVGCELERPGLFTFSSPSDACWLGWFASAQNLDGIYYDGYNKWTVEPLLDSRISTGPAGSGNLIYPGCRSSIRFERLKEGIQDYEKISMLKASLDSEKIKLLNSTLSKFTINRMADNETGDMIDKGQELINQLSIFE